MLGYYDGYGNNPARPVTRGGVTIETIKATNLLEGQHFFDKSSMQFFQSHILPTVYRDRYFITSEVNPRHEKAYTVREAVDGGKSIKTVGNFHSFKTADDAREYIRQIAE